MLRREYELPPEAIEEIQRDIERVAQKYMNRKQKTNEGGETMTNKKAEPSSPDIKELLSDLRKLAPVRALRYSEHMNVAERQATRLHQLLGQRGPAASLVWLTEAPSISVILQPRWKMNGLSGLTLGNRASGSSASTRANSHTRRRFTLMHEFKHLLDAPRDRITYRTINEDQRELLANYFAACYLMPESWLRRAWTRGCRMLRRLPVCSM